MIRDYFKNNCISIRQWAKKHNLSERTSYMVINGEVLGHTNFKTSKKVFEALLSEGIIKQMPAGFIKKQDEESDKKAS